MTNFIDVWKQFSESELSHSAAHHLMAIQKLLEAQGYVRRVDISRYLKVSRASAAITLNRLIERGYLQEDANKFLQLTEKGKKLVQTILCNRRIVQQFFQEVLGLSEEEAEAEACKIEHLLSRNTGRKLMAFLCYLMSDEPSIKDFRQQSAAYIQSCSRGESCEDCQYSCAGF